MNSAADTAWQGCWRIMEYRGKRKKEPPGSLVCLVLGSDHTGLASDLYRGWRHGRGAGSVSETCLREQLGGQLLSSYGGWHVRARRLQCAILPDIRPQQQPVLTLLIPAAAGQLEKLSITKRKSRVSTLRCTEQIYYKQTRCKQKQRCVYRPVSFRLIFINVLLKSRCSEI